MDHEKYMKQALDQAEEAIALNEFPVGCVIEYHGNIIASGQRTHTTLQVNELDHAEILALRNLLNSEYDIDMAEVTVYSTMEPCLMCFSTLLVNGVRRFVYAYEDAMGGGTNLPLTSLSPLYKDLQITLVKDVLRDKSLNLFKSFFSNPANNYLRGSLLAAYTLQQEITTNQL